MEDEPFVRQLTARMLGDLGYHVLLAGNGEEAQRTAAGHAGPIHLLLSDVVMPQLGGGEPAQQMLALRPELKVLLVSGYTEDRMLPQSVRDREVAFLQKPFTFRELGLRVREVLDGGSR